VSSCLRAFLLLSVSSVALPSLAHADPVALPPPPPVRANDPSRISGLQSPGQQPSDAALAFADAALWPVRAIVDLVFFTTGNAAGLIENEQIVPRVESITNPPRGKIGLFPTAFTETGSSPNVGARLVANAGNLASTLRAGYGGEDVWVVESRLRYAAKIPFPAVVSFEGLTDRRTGIGFLGVGQSPESDPRNHFVQGPVAGIYREKRQRFITGAGIRPASDTEVLVSTSYTYRNDDDDPSALSAGDAFSQVFVPGSVGSALSRNHRSYTEVAIRVDTRETRGAPVAGALFESYGGYSTDFEHEHTDFVRVGGRIAGFVPIYRRTNVLSPKLVLDAVAPVAGSTIPFFELAHNPDFRGPDTRRDNVALVASLDYRWKVMRFLAARFFGDATTVAERVHNLRVDGMRWILGGGVDLFGSAANLVRLSLGAGPDGVQFAFSLGLPGPFGDRQHQ
jgi:hypothetical protein